MHLRTVAAMAIAATLTGCQTVGLPSRTEKPVLPKAWLSEQLPAGPVPVRVSRGDTMAGAACDVWVSVDGAPVVRLAADQYVEFGVTAGSHSFRAHYALKGICPEHVSVLRVDAKAGDSVRLIYDIPGGGSAHVWQRLD